MLYRGAAYLMQRYVLGVSIYVTELKKNDSITKKYKALTIISSSPASMPSAVLAIEVHGLSFQAFDAVP